APHPRRPGHRAPDARPPGPVGDGPDLRRGPHRGQRPQRDDGGLRRHRLLPPLHPARLPPAVAPGQAQGGPQGGGEGPLGLPRLAGRLV
ncbi:MAG: hypothetical protein AVDCRST_MAG13-3250, partial [uncultured Solirubrobacteraceae bacterium]